MKLGPRCSVPGMLTAFPLCMAMLFGKLAASPWGNHSVHYLLDIIL